jgi:hypothetical protein
MLTAEERMELEVLRKHGAGIRSWRRPQNALPSAFCPAAHRPEADLPPARSARSTRNVLFRAETGGLGAARF